MRRQIRVIKIKRTKKKVEDKWSSDSSQDGILWDKLYLVPKKDEEMIPRLFDFALVFPKTKKFKSALEVIVDKYTTCKEHSMHRNDSPEMPFEKELLDGKDLIVIPILGKFFGGALRPAYLSSREHTHALDKKYKRKYSYVHPKTIPEDAYLSTPDGAITPICSICASSMKGATGECQLGIRDCYSNLIFGKNSLFKKDEFTGDPEIKEDFSGLDKDVKDDLEDLKENLEVCDVGIQ